MKVNYEIREFGSADLPRPNLRDISRLHSELLPHSPVVIMGSEFMESFYYNALSGAGLISGAVAYVDDVAAGFIVATAWPNDFMKRALKKYWFRCATSMALSLLKRPSRLLALKEAYDIQKNAAAQDFPADMGELLSFGVLKEFRSRRFVRENEANIAHDLQSSALRQLRKCGVRRIRAVVDQDNLEAKLFYRSSGWQIGNPEVIGWSVPTTEFVRNVE